MAQRRYTDVSLSIIHDWLIDRRDECSKAIERTRALMDGNNDERVGLAGTLNYYRQQLGYLSHLIDRVSPASKTTRKRGA